MNSFSLALSFIRIPRLFLSLLFWPLILGVFIALAQVALSLAYFGIMAETSADYQEKVVARSLSKNWIANKIIGKSLDPNSKPRICRWQQLENGREKPLGSDCELEFMDLVINSENPNAASVENYVQHFTGAVNKVHVCRNCSAGISISPSKNHLNINSLQGMGVYMLNESAKQQARSKHKVEFLAEQESQEEIEGTVLLHPQSFPYPINLSQLPENMLLILNAASIVIITLWLSLKAHTRVLDYFSKNDALLPLVASCGKRTFYKAIWVITLTRVSFFLLASVPATVFFYAKLLKEEALSNFISDPLYLLLWVLGIVSSLSLVAIIASIAELKRRFSLAGFIYQYMPLIVCLLGFLAWLQMIFSAEETSVWISKIITSTPILGLGPLLISPIAFTEPKLICVHIIFSTILISILLRKNSDWFAAHLGEM